jgi:chaperonin GroES
VSRESRAVEQLSVLFDRVLVDIDDSDGERRSRAGILIPATAQIAKRLTWATVVAVGPHVRAVSPGQRVLFSADDRYDVELDGDDYVLLRERDLHAVARSEESPGTGLYL